MSNPWSKKNPLMSIWLSAAHSAAGSMRGQAGGQAKRQASVALTKMTQDVFRLWAELLTPKQRGPSYKRKR